jgi:predicted nuclease of predicted toxin-antitoxin system
MKIQIDESLHVRLVSHLRDLFPQMQHVSAIGLTSKPDTDVWHFSAEHSFAAILTADVDFQNRVLELGTPPKVIRIERCDVSSKEILMLIRREVLRIQEFFESTRPLLLLRR